MRAMSRNHARVIEAVVMRGIGWRYSGMRWPDMAVMAMLGGMVAMRVGSLVGPMYQGRWLAFLVLV